MTSRKRTHTAAGQTRHEQTLEVSRGLGNHVLFEITLVHFLKKKKKKKKKKEVSVLINKQNHKTKERLKEGERTYVRRTRA